MTHETTSAFDLHERTSDVFEKVGEHGAVGARTTNKWFVMLIGLMMCVLVAESVFIIIQRGKIEEATDNTNQILSEIKHLKDENEKLRKDIRQVNYKTSSLSTSGKSEALANSENSSSIVSNPSTQGMSFCPSCHISLDYGCYLTH